MSVSSWSILWQVVLALTIVAFFSLAAWLSRGAIRDLRDVFRDLSDAQTPPDDARH